MKSKAAFAAGLWIGGLIAGAVTFFILSPWRSRPPVVSQPPPPPVVAAVVRPKQGIPSIDQSIKPPVSGREAPQVEQSASFVTSKVAGDQRVPLKLDLPKPIFIGTPKNLRTANLEPPRPPGAVTIPMVPADTTNVALKKQVTGSDKEPVIGELSLVTDGDKEGTDGSYVELGPGVQWVQIDLAQPYAIYAIALWHYHSEARVYFDVIVQVADDAAFTQNVRTVFNNDHDNSGKLGIGRDYEYIETSAGKVIDTEGVMARYVRLYSRGNTANEMNHYVEVEVFGK